MWSYINMCSYIIPTIHEVNKAYFEYQIYFSILYCAMTNLLSLDIIDHSTELEKNLFRC